MKTLEQLVRPGCPGAETLLRDPRQNMPAGDIDVARCQAKTPPERGQPPPTRTRRIWKQRIAALKGVRCGATDLHRQQHGDRPIDLALPHLLPAPASRQRRLRS